MFLLEEDKCLGESFSVGGCGDVSRRKTFCSNHVCFSGLFFFFPTVVHKVGSSDLLREVGSWL